MTSSKWPPKHLRWRLNETSGTINHLLNFHIAIYSDMRDRFGSLNSVFEACKLWTIDKNFILVRFRFDNQLNCLSLQKFKLYKQHWRCNDKKCAIKYNLQYKEGNLHPVGERLQCYSLDRLRSLYPGFAHFMRKFMYNFRLEMYLKSVQLWRGIKVCFVKAVKLDLALSSNNCYNDNFMDTWLKAFTADPSEHIIMNGCFSSGPQVFVPPLYVLRTTWVSLYL